MDLFYGIDQNNRLVHVDDVPNGLKCGCVCPSCHAPLVARNGGSILAHHFAHSSGTECATGYQTSIHLLAKEIIQDAKRIYLPEIVARYAFRVPEVEDEFIYETERGDRELRFSACGNEAFEKKFFAGGFVSDRIESVELEQSQGGMIPDIVVHFKDGARLFVEIYVTHKVDEEKKEKLRAQGVSCIEINLSAIERGLSKAELAKLLYDEDFMEDHCHWAYNKKTELFERQYTDYVSKAGTWVPFKVKESSQGTGKIWYTTYRCPANGYRMLDGTQFRTEDCLTCPCCCGATPCDEAYYGLPEQIKAFCIYKAFRKINDTFNLGLGIECHYDDNIVSIYEE